MDLVQTLRNKIDVLGDEDCVPGLKAVLGHIESAFRHLSRGQEQPDQTLFNDAIYRTNQAFEGSLKEAYRVLADQEPGRKTPSQIETFLEEKFKPRVLSQLKNYRTEWRNPSTHDYTLLFDESEAFLAIVSVCAFSCLLLDQITERVAFTKGQADAEAEKENETFISTLALAKQAGLLEWVNELFLGFFNTLDHELGPSPAVWEAQVIGGVTGYIGAISPELFVDANHQLDYGADLVVSDGEDRVIVEFKLNYNPRLLEHAIRQVHYAMVNAPSSTKALVVMGAAPNMKQVRVKSLPGRQIIALVPSDAIIPSKLLGE